MSRSQTTQSTKSMQQVDTAEFASSMLESLDTDGDGALSIEETDLSEDMFANFDTDGDGLHSLEELESALSEIPSGAQGPSGPPPGGPPPSGGQMDASEASSSLISSLDTDGDGVLSIEETDLSEELFAEIDSDGDGVLAQEEVETFMSENAPDAAGTAPPPPPSGVDSEQAASDLLSSLDTNSDGVLSIEETDLSEELFAELDTDGDGYHSTEEIQAAMEDKAAEDNSKFFDALNQMRGQAAYQQTSLMSSLMGGSSDWFSSSALSGLSVMA